jgi:hypothetical protein
VVIGLVNPPSATARLERATAIDTFALLSENTIRLSLWPKISCLVMEAREVLQLSADKGRVVQFGIRSPTFECCAPRPKSSAISTDDDGRIACVVSLHKRKTMLEIQCTGQGQRSIITRRTENAIRKINIVGSRSKDHLQ